MFLLVDSPNFNHCQNRERSCTFLYFLQAILLLPHTIPIFAEKKMITALSDEHFMKLALAEAEKARKTGEVPVGAIVVCNNVVIARAHNQTEILHDVTAHAEMLALTAASNYLGGKYLNDCTLFVTLEPCPMCAGALNWAQIGRIVYGAADDKKGFFRFGKEILHPKTKVEFGIMQEESSLMLTKFFKARR